MVDLIIRGGGSEIYESLLDDNICDQYNIIDWEYNEDNYNIMVYFNNIYDRFDFQCDYNINLEEEKEGYIREDHI